MFITKKHLSRRTFLRAGGATVALPLLSAMIPARTALSKTAAAVKPRMGFFYLPHGAIMDNTHWGKSMNRWTPDKEGPNFDFKPILEPFKPHQAQMTVVSGLGNQPAESSAVHAIIPGTWLSCVHPRRSQSPYAGVTIDQIAARHNGQDTPLPSLEIATAVTGGSSQCDASYGCSYSRTISFRTHTTPLPMETDPGKVFDKIFGRGRTPEQRKDISNDFTSILDMVQSEASSLRRKIGPGDRAIVDDYLGSVREIERRMHLLSKRDLSHVDLPEIPVAEPAFPEHLQLMYDLLRVAYQTNMTRIATFIQVAEVSNQSYAFVGVPDAFHPLSHHGGKKEAMEKLVIIQRYHSKMFADFLAKLEAMPDGDAGSMLDNSVFLYGSNMSNSNKHNTFPLPTLVFGHGGGTIKGNQHLRYPDHTPLADVLFTLLLRAGVPVESIGDSKRELSEI